MYCDDEEVIECVGCILVFEMLEFVKEYYIVEYMGNYLMVDMVVDVDEFK